MGFNLSKQLGNRVRDLRTRAGLTQAQLADRIDVSHEFMSRLERGLKTPSLSTAGKIAESLGMEMVGLFDFGGSGRTNEKEDIVEGIRSLLLPLPLDHLKIIQAVAKTLVSELTTTK